MYLQCIFGQQALVQYVALYPSVPQEEGIQIMAEALRAAGVDERVIDFLVRATRAVLGCNTFEWLPLA